MPLGRLIHSYDQDAVALWNANFEEGLKIAKATGAKEVWSGARRHADDPPAWAAPSWAPAPPTRWPTATARPTRCPNLYIAGPGIFPTEGASNPTYTIFALSLRGAEHLAAKWEHDRRTDRGHAPLQSALPALRGGGRAQQSRLQALSRQQLPRGLVLDRAQIGGAEF